MEPEEDVSFDGDSDEDMDEGDAGEEGGKLYIIFHIKDHSDSTHRSRRSLLEANGGLPTVTWDRGGSPPSPGSGLSPWSSDPNGLDSEASRTPTIQKRGLVTDANGPVDYKTIYKADHDLSYEDAEIVGNWLLSLVNAEDSCVEQSKWIKSEDLEGRGWNVEPPRKPDTTKKNKWQKDTFQALTRLDVPTDDDHNQEITVRHNRKTEIDGETYYPSGAWYHCSTLR